MQSFFKRKGCKNCLEVRFYKAKTQLAPTGHLTWCDESRSSKFAQLSIHFYILNVTYNNLSSLLLFLGDPKLYLSSNKMMDWNFRKQLLSNDCLSSLVFFPNYTVNVYFTSTLLSLCKHEGEISKGFQSHRHRISMYGQRNQPLHRTGLGNV